MNSEKLTNWQKVKQAVETLGGKTTNVKVRDWILQKYPDTNQNSIQAILITCAVNHPSRIHYPENSKPRLANAQYDFLYRTGRGEIELYDSTIQGQWEIYKTELGRLDIRIVGEESEPVADEADIRKTVFAAEFHLRDFLKHNLELIEQGLELYVDENGNDGVEYRTPVGLIDLLTIDKNGDFLVIELKVAKGPDYVAGQILRYKNWVKRNIANGKNTRGVIIAQYISDKIKYAIADDPEVTTKEYELNIKIKNAPELQL